MLWSTLSEGCRPAKRWGVFCYCLTMKGVHLDVLSSMDLDAFLTALQMFIAWEGKAIFRSRNQFQRKWEGVDLQQQLATQQISSHFNPPPVVHFDGAWEREISSLKAALYTAIGSQWDSERGEEVLRTVLAEIGSILHSKHVGCISASVAYLDPVSPNYVLIWQPHEPRSELLVCQRWGRLQVLYR